jgi:hypothetical protein
LRDALAILKWQGLMGATMNFSSSNDRSLLTLWESVRRQVIADRAASGRCRFVGQHVRAYAEALRSEMDRRQLKYPPIEWN